MAIERSLVDWSKQLVAGVGLPGSASGHGCRGCWSKPRPRAPRRPYGGSPGPGATDPVYAAEENSSVAALADHITPASELFCRESRAEGRTVARLFALAAHQQLSAFANLGAGAGRQPVRPGTPGCWDSCLRLCRPGSSGSERDAGGWQLGTAVSASSPPGLVGTRQPVPAEADDAGREPSQRSSRASSIFPAETPMASAPSRPRRCAAQLAHLSQPHARTRHFSKLAVICSRSPRSVLVTVLYDPVNPTTAPCGSFFHFSGRAVRERPSS